VFGHESQAKTWNRDTSEVMTQFFRLDGQVALVTGGGRGIGAGIARRLHAAGARVAVFDRDLPSAQALADEIEGLALVGDVCSEHQVADAVDLTERHLGPLSIVVNNAGITGRTDLSWNLEVDEVRSVIEVNTIGPFLFCKAAVPRFLDRGYGRIVNVASIAGKEGNPTLMPYSASKAAVIALTKSLAKELAGKGDITVNAISPAVIRTAILDGVAPATVDYMVSKIPMGRTGTIDEVAALVHYLASPEASFTTGQCYDISGGRATY
jgi:NAD(P)-dependent dehydrogenase (short-subunit alcohol dehydrogenase family)